MWKWISLALLSSMLLSGCSVALFEVKYVAPPRTPRSTAPSEGLSIPSLLELSRQETIDGTKTWALNGLISAEYSSAMGLSENNCVQASALKNGDIIIDFGDVPCPADRGLIPAESIVISLFHEESGSEDFPPKFDLLLDVLPLGSAQAVDADTVMLTDLCNGEYADRCAVLIAENRFAGLKLK